MFGLKDTDIHLINSVFENYSCITKIGEDINLTTLLKIENELDDLLLPYQIDLSIYNKIENLDLISHIKRMGIVFYERNTL